MFLFPALKKDALVYVFRGVVDSHEAEKIQIWLKQ